MKTMGIIWKIAFKNLKRRPVRTGCMIFFVFMLSASLFFSSMLVGSMEGTLQKTTDRMGADLIVVPKEFEKSMADSLFLGELCSFSFDRSWVDDIISIEGIRDATPQLYLESLAADCCSAATQLIAFDPETDYIVTPWLEKDNLPAPGKNQMYLGSSITPSEPGKIKFFGVEYEVLGQLERTGTSYDTCAFMTWDTAQEIMGCEKWVQSFGEPKGEAEDLISSIMIRVEDGTDAKAVARKINFQLDGAPVAAYTTNGIFNGVMESVAGMTGYCTVLMALILVLVTTALVTVFTITMNERTEEFGILASLGVSSRRLGGIVLTEGSIIGLAGGLLGAGTSAACLLMFAVPIQVKLHIPKLLTSVRELAAAAAFCILLSLAVSLASSLYSAWKVSRTNLDGLIKGEEL